MFRKNKKGQFFGPNISLIATSIVVVIILIISFVLVRLIVSPAGNLDSENSLKSQAITSLQAYLQTPVDVDVGGKIQQMEMSDLIRLAKLNSDYKDAAKVKTKEIFDPAFTQKYKLEVSDLFTIYGHLDNPTYQTGGLYGTLGFHGTAGVTLPGEITVTFSLP